MYDIATNSLNSSNSDGSTVLESKLSEDIRTIRLRRNGCSPLGFAIRGGWEHGTGIFVSEVYSESEAEKEGLKPGDQVLRVNGFSIDKTFHDEVISLIKSATKIVLRVKSTGMIPIKDNRTEPLQWKFIGDMPSNGQLSESSSSQSRPQYKPQKSKSKCPIHSLKKEDGQIAKSLLLKSEPPGKLMPSKAAKSIELNSAGSSPTSSVSSKCSSSSITSSSLSSCSKLIAKSCKSPLSSSSSQPKSKLNGYYSRSLSNLATSTDYLDGFSLTTINFTRNKSTLNLASPLSPADQTTSSSTEDDRHSTLEKVKTIKYASVYINLSNRESLGCSVVKGPPKYPGIFIQTVKPNGVAEKAGLEIGDQIITINDMSCLSEHMTFEQVIEKIKSCKQMKFKVKKNTAIGQILEQQTATNKNRKMLAKKTLLNELSSSSSCNESASPVVGSHVASTTNSNYSRRSSKSNSCACHLPYYMNKFASSSRHNLARPEPITHSLSPAGQYPNGQFNKLPEKCTRSSLSGSSKRSLRKGVAHHRSYTSLLSSNNSTYGQRMNGYHSPVCLRHSSANYYSQSENDYSMYELEERNEKKKIDLIVSGKFVGAKNRTDSYGGYCKNRQFKSKSIKNLARSSLYDCEKCNCLGYYAGSDCNELDYHKKTGTAFNRPINSNLLKQKLLSNNLSCSNLTFKSPVDVGLSNCQQLYTMLNSQMNALQLTNCLNEEAKSKSNLELNDELLNNTLYEKMRLEKERLAIERKKLENEQLRLQEEKDKFEREKKQMETIKQHEELKQSSSRSSSSTMSTTSAAASQSISSVTTQSSIGFLDEIKKLAERRTNDHSLITDTLNKTRFGSTGPAGVRLVPIADGKIKHVHPDDEKRKQHEILMQEFRAAHHKMFGSKLASNADANSKPIAESSGVSTGSQAANHLTNQSDPNTSSSDSKCNVPVDRGDSSSSAESCSSIQTNGATSDTTSIAVTANKTIISPPPPLPPSLTSTLNGLNTFGQPANGNQDGKIRKLNTFGKLVPTNESPANKLPANVLPKNNLNGLNQSETVKILRTSSPNKKKGPAPSPPISCQAARIETTRIEAARNESDKTAKIVRVNKKNEKIAFLSGSSRGQPIKLEGQRNGSVVDGALSAENQANYLSAKPDLSLSSLSIKVQAQ